MKRLAFLLSLLFFCGEADAQKKADVQKARAHFKAGEAFFNAGLWERAIDEYNAAYGLAPRPQLLFNLGAAYRRKAEVSKAAVDLRAAVDHYRRYLEAEPGGQGAVDARAYLTTLTPAAEAAEREEALHPRPPPEPVPVPPSTPVTAPVVAPPLTSPPPVADVRPRRAKGWRVAGLVTAGTGAALVGTGVIFGLRSSAASDKLQGSTDMWDQDLYDAGRRDQRIMVVLVSAGGAAVVGGAVMFFILGRDRPPARKVTVRPTAFIGGGGIVVGGPID